MMNEGCPDPKGLDRLNQYLHSLGCPGCNSGVAENDRYCGRCGTINPHFHQKYAAALEESLRTECMQGHPGAESLGDWEEGEMYCPDCGQLIPPLD